MKVYWPYQQFPELAAYEKWQRQVIWLNLSQWQPGPKRRFWENVWVGVIVLGFVLGILIGARLATNLTLGGLLGGLVGLLAPAPFIYLMGLNARRSCLRQYLQSAEFSLTPCNSRVQALLRPCHPGPQPVPHVLRAGEGASAVEGAGISLDLNPASSPPQPMPRLVALVLQQALYDGAERIEVRLADAAAVDGLRISYWRQERRFEVPPVSGTLFAPFVAVLCHHAGIEPTRRGAVEGDLRTRGPESTWRLESEDLRTGLWLSRGTARAEAKLA